MIGFSKQLPAIVTVTDELLLISILVIEPQTVVISIYWVNRDRTEFHQLIFVNHASDFDIIIDEGLERSIAAGIAPESLRDYRSQIIAAFDQVLATYASNSRFESELDDHLPIAYQQQRHERSEKWRLLPPHAPPSRWELIIVIVIVAMLVSRLLWGMP
jgi:hypothetical protein